MLSYPDREPIEQPSADEVAGLELPPVQHERRDGWEIAVNPYDPSEPF